MHEHAARNASSDSTTPTLGHILFGLYLWEWFISLGFEWDFIIGKKRLRWPMFFYFVNRYLLLGHFISSMILWNSKGQEHPINCNVVYAFMRFFGKGALAFASINLALRTIAVWERNKYVTTGLALIMLGEFSIIFLDVRDVLKSSRWSVQGHVCVNGSKNDWLRIVFLISMSFDLLVLGLNVYKIGIKTAAFTRYCRERRRERSILRLTYLVLSQGIVYFFVAFCVNAAAFIVVTLPGLRNTNASRTYALPAYVLSTIVACRAVRALTKSGSHFENLPVLSNDPAFDISIGVGSNPGPTRASFLPSIGGKLSTEDLENKQIEVTEPSARETRSDYLKELKVVPRIPLESDDKHHSPKRAQDFV
ncbi:hypothetical protein CPB83DRAFT_91560 [Crepidotus variabilis]|uniref:Uncharacterized protein n=1 Tax=Crepidotus variabilis TaxID=179855 RepID=A0A9P6E595_9AGAR|nr:hypothetical protein CPB83DRAFT_91560 [Crepidotus variabilis]